MKNWFNKNEAIDLMAVLAMFIGPLLMVGLIVFAVQDSLGVRTVMHVMAEHHQVVPMCYVGIMLGSLLFGFGRFGKVMES